MANFNFYNINFSKIPNTGELLVRGEIENRSDRDYSAVAIRIMLYVGNVIVVNSVAVVNGLPKRTTKDFDKIIEGKEYDLLGKRITRQEFFVESSY